MSYHTLSAPIADLPHQHLRQPQAATFIGELSCGGDPARYVAATAAVLARAAAAPTAPLPLVVNTAGWVKVRLAHHQQASPYVSCPCQPTDAGFLACRA